MSAISDRARDFWDRISPRERRLVVIAAILTPLTITVWLGSAINDGLDAMAARNNRDRKALAVLADLRARGQTTEQPGEDLVKHMPTDTLSLPTYLDGAAKKAGFELKAVVTPHSAQPRDGFITKSVSLSLDQMTLEQAKDFLEAIETDSKYVAITHLEMRRNFRDHEKVDIPTLEVTTYAKAPADKGNGSGSGSGGGSGSDASGSQGQGG